MPRSDGRRERIWLSRLFTQNSNKQSLSSPACSAHANDVKRWRVGSFNHFPVHLPAPNRHRSLSRARERENHAADRSGHHHPRLPTSLAFFLCLVLRAQATRHPPVQGGEGADQSVLPLSRVGRVRHRLPFLPLLPPLACRRAGSAGARKRERKEGWGLVEG